MFYSYQKWFVDCLLASGDYALVFLSTVAVAGRRWTSISCRLKRAAIEAYRYTTPVKTGTALTHGWQADINTPGCLHVFTVGASGARIEIDLPRLRLSLDYPAAGLLSRDLGLAVVAAHGKCLRWRPVLMCDSIHGSIVADGAVLSLEKATGYVDHVSSTILPFKVPVRQISWGRAIGSGLKLAYTVINGAGGLQGSLCAFIEGRYWRGDATADLMEPSRDRASGIVYPAVTAVRAAAPGFSITARWLNRRVLIADRFMEDAHVKPSFINTALRRLARDPAGLKFGAEIETEVTVNGRTKRLFLSGINEYAEFRTSARLT